MMPEMDGYETANALKQSEKTKRIPIIFLTALAQSKRELKKGYEVGAVDFLLKPVEPIVLESKVNVFLELASRYYSHLSFLLMDLDYFKSVNDTCGHPFGDYVLHEFARHVTDMTRHSDVLARYSGEEFGLIMPHTDGQAAVLVAEKIRKEIRSTEFSSGGHYRYISMSIGICSFFGDQVVSPGEFIAFADKALYQAKGEGRDQVVLYDPAKNPDNSSRTPLTPCDQESQQTMRVYQRPAENIT